jgi:signal transduction histidine kinase
MPMGSEGQVYERRIQQLQAELVRKQQFTMTQVVSNLLLNAAKFTPKGGDIRVSIEHECRCVKLSVRDTGIGITAEALPSIFDIYVRGAQATEDARGDLGLGLGLAVARQLADAHGGTLCVRSAGPGEGSEFVLRLPLPVSR